MHKFPVFQGQGATNRDKAIDARRQYFAKFGVHAPPFDPARRRKMWMDPDAAKLDPKTPIEYSILTNSGPSKITLTAGEAATVNMPGPYDWPEWRPQPTAASFVTGEGGVGGMGPDQLSSREQAEALRVELGGERIYEADTLINWNGETRRFWQLVWRGRTYNVGLLLKERNGGTRVDSGYNRGIGAPGKWDLSGPDPKWIPAPETDNGTEDTRPMVPVPIRDLAPGEKWDRVGMMGTWQIVKDQPTSPVADSSVLAAVQALQREVVELRAEVSEFRKRAMDGIVTIIDSLPQ